MLRAILSKYWKQLHGHFPHISKNVQVIRTRHERYCWRSKDELICDILQWTPIHGGVIVGQLARFFLYQFFADRGYSLEDLPGVKDNRDGCRERMRKICVVSVFSA